MSKIDWRPSKQKQIWALEKRVNQLAELISTLETEVYSPGRNLFGGLLARPRPRLSVDTRLNRLEDAVVPQCPTCGVRNCGHAEEKGKAKK